MSEIQLDYTLSEREVCFSLDESEHDREAIYTACYHFVDRCWVFLSQQNGRTEARLRAKETVDSGQLDAIAESFAQNLVHAELHIRIARAAAPLREQYTSRALFGRHQDPTVAELLSELDDEEDDDLVVTVPWKKDDG